MTPNPLRNFLGQIIERNDPIRDPRSDKRPGHAPHYRARLVLSQHLASGIADPLASKESVLTHARHHDRKNVGTIDLGDRSEQDINGRAA
jgi:hypothetical protein